MTPDPTLLAGPAPGLVVRPARDDERRACRILLPDMFTASQAPDLLVATLADPARPDAPRLVGAAGLGTVHGRAARDFPFLAHVVPSWRRRGIGRALVEAAVDHCRGKGDILRAFQPVPSESGAAGFLAACGFDGRDRIVHFETDARAFHADMLRVRQRLEQRGRIRMHARVVPLRDAPAARVADLVSRHFPITRAQLLARLDPRSTSTCDLNNSVALLVGEPPGAEMLGGALIYGWDGDVPVIEARVVDPALRGGWANALMLEQATRNGVAAGARRFRFFADDRLYDTMNLARRAGAEQIKVELQFWRRIA